MSAIIGSLITADARAYTPYTAPKPAAGSEPSVSTTMDHSKINRDGRQVDPKQGDRFDYTARITFSNMAETEVARPVTITVTADSNAPFQTPVTASDFTHSAGSLRSEPRITCEANSCSVRYESMPDGTVVFSKSAVVKSGLAAGEVISGAVSARVESKSKVRLQTVDRSFTPDAGRIACGGTAEWKVKVPGPGGWLADLKLADANASGKVKFDAEPLVNGQENPSARNSIKVVTGDGRDITGNILSSSTYNPNDPSKPFLGMDEVSRESPGARWLQSLNWPFDTSNYTGTAWLPSGTVLTIKRHLTFYDCAVGGFPSPADFFNSRWKAGLALQIGRPNTSVNASAYTQFSMPGKIEPASCVNSLYVSQESTAPGSPNNFYQIRGGDTRNLGVNPSDTRSIAVTQRHQELIFTITPIEDRPAPVRLRVYDTSTRRQRDLNVPGTEYANALGFDKYGYLWTIATSGQIRYLTAENIDSLVGGGRAEWTTTGTLEKTRVSLMPTQNNAFDIAFDGNDVAYITRPLNLFKVTRAELLAGGVVPMRNSVPIRVYWPNGLAFLGNELYIGYGWRNQPRGNGNQVRQIDKVNTDTGALENATSSLGYSGMNISDLASCSFPAGGTGGGTEFKVRKSVIDPVTGAVVPAGETSPNRATVGRDGTVSVDYVIAVTVTGNRSGRHPRIDDVVSVPPGFTITDILVNGRSQGSSGRFMIPGEQLDPSRAESTAKFHTVRVTARAADPVSVDWAKAGVCNTSGAGRPAAGGFFNKVAMESDSDGADNNDACISVDPRGTAQLRLIKRIAGPGGVEIPSLASEARHFDLIAGGPTYLKGTSSTSGAVAVDGRVLAGDYRLTEQPNDGGSFTGKYSFGTWKCNSGKVPSPDGLITLRGGENVTCTVTNTPNPRMRIVKTATEVAPADQNTPAVVNDHIGRAVNPGDDGRLEMKYKVTVNNDSEYAGRAGMVTDTFRPPAGLVWDGKKNARVAFDANETTARAAGLATNLTESQLRDSAVLARAINNIPAKGKVSFSLTIPLRIDTSKASGGVKSVFDVNAERLGTCSMKASGSGYRYTDTALGVPNLVGLADEDLTYSDVALADNVACIPVVSRGAVQVSKWADAAATTHVGAAPVDFDTSGQAEVSYWVKLANVGSVPYRTSLVTDVPGTPGRLRIVGNMVRLRYQLGGNSATVDGRPLMDGASRTARVEAGRFILGDSFELAGRGTEPSGPPVMVQVTYRLEYTPGANGTPTAASIGACRPIADGTVPWSSPGLLNKVELDAIDTDSDGTPNNIACLPVRPRVKVVKQAEACDVGSASCQLNGAEFALYPDDGSGLRPASRALPGGIEVDPANGAVFNSMNLNPGEKYWLVETRAPANFELLAQPIGFSVEAGGVTVFAGQAAGIFLDSERPLTLNIVDQARGELPVSGAPGRWPTGPLGLLFLVMATWLITRSSKRRRGGPVS